MKKKIIDRIKTYYTLLKEKLDQKVIIFIIFLFVSTIFWFLSALNHEYSTDISYPVRYINFPSDKILVNELPSHFDLLVESYGYTILKHKLRSNRRRIIFNVSTYPLINFPNNPSKYYILTSAARDKISNQISSDLHLLEVKPDSIILEFSKAISKKIPIKPNVEINLVKQYTLKNGIVTVPDSILISGPANIIDTLKYVPTKFQKFNKVDEPIHKNISIITKRELKYPLKKVALKINVEQYTETQTTIPISYANLPDSFTIKVFPNHVTVLYNVCLSDYNKLNNNLFEAIVDFNEMKFTEEKQPDFLTVKLIRYPDFIQSVRYKPDKVEYLIKKK